MKTRKIIGCNKPKYNNLASSSFHTTYLMLYLNLKHNTHIKQTLFQRCFYFEPNMVADGE